MTHSTHTLKIVEMKSILVANLKFTNAPEADKLLTKTYRKGFEVAAA